MEDISLHILDIVENSITAKAKNIKIKMVKKKDYLIVGIEDDGIGMSEETIKRCLDPFFTTKGKRVGLGVPLLYQACKETGGDLKIESKEGKGTKIRARFKLSHIDCKPLGNMGETLKVLKVANPDINFIYDKSNH